MTGPETADLAILIGRFQPFHSGHAALLETAMRCARRVIVVLGSAFHARNPKNPLTWQERATMIADTLPEKERRRLNYVPVRDYYDTRRWAQVVAQEVHKLAPDAKRIALIGHFKDTSDHYLTHFPNWNLIEAGDLADVDATHVRKIMFEAENVDIALDVLSGALPDAVRHYLKSWSRLPCFEQLCAEHHSLESYKKAWSNTPYPPVFSTVDAVVRAAGHVLLIKRGFFPGMGLWALPGGFLDQRERLLQAAIRELQEETNLGVLYGTLLDSLVDVKVFDHPDRSLRGRTITHAHFFDLKLEQLPEVRAADDAAHASWVKIEELAAAEEFFFDDHFHILDHFLGLTQP